MEFFDPKKRKAYVVRLMVGYVLIGVALVLMTVILLYNAYGFGYKNGEVIQNGLVFISSRPRPATVYVNNEKHQETTNTRLLLPAGQYTVRLERNGYHTWQRAINIEGGSVVHFDYPVLFPLKLNTETVKKYDAKPDVVTQSMDKRWLVVHSGAVLDPFELYDLNTPEKTPESLVLPAGLVNSGAGTHRWESMEWADDNKHVLLRHTLTAAAGSPTVEYVLVNIDEVATSVNVTKTLGKNYDRLGLQDKKFDQYFVYDRATRVLATVSLDTPTPNTFLERVLDYKTHGDDIVVFATEPDSTVAAQTGKVVIKLRQDGHTYAIRTVNVHPNGTYALDVASYSGAWYVVAGSATDNRVYVYKSPATALKRAPQEPIVPVAVLKTTSPDYIAFSDNARFIMSEHGQQFAIYDAENDKSYLYTTAHALDAPQAHAGWMDGHRLAYVTAGKLVVFDFDNTNVRTLQSADPQWAAMFNRNYSYAYTFGAVTTKVANGTTLTQTALQRTALVTSPDL